MGINPQATITVSEIQMKENVGNAVSSVFLNALTNKTRNKSAAMYIQKGGGAHIEFLRQHAIRKSAKNTAVEIIGYELDGFIKLKTSYLNEGTF